MCQNGEQYEYIAVYVDDIAFALKDPQPFIDTLKAKYNFKIKEAGPLEFHLEADFFRDDEGTLCMAPQKYIERLTSSYEKMFGEKPSAKMYSPLERGTTLSWMTLSSLMLMAYSNISHSLDQCNGPSPLDVLTLLQQSCPC